MNRNQLFCALISISLFIISLRVSASSMDERCPETNVTRMGQPPAVLYKPESGATVLVCGNEDTPPKDDKHKVTDFTVLSRFPSGNEKTVFAASPSKVYTIWNDPKQGLGFEEWIAGAAYFRSFVTCTRTACTRSKETCSIEKKKSLYPNIVGDVKNQLQTGGEQQAVFLDNMIEELELQVFAGDKAALTMLFSPELKKGATGNAALTLKTVQADVRRLQTLGCLPKN